jgi:hypothetical protein
VDADFLPGYVCPNVKELIAPRTQLGGDTAAGYGWFVSHPGTPKKSYGRVATRTLATMRSSQSTGRPRTCWS